MKPVAAGVGVNQIEDIEDLLTEQDRLNQRVWSTPTAERDLDFNQRYTDEGERLALALIAPEVRGKPILDLGVGRGRTISILTPLTPEYRAVDYMPQMVEVSRARHPGVDISLADARSLSGFPADHFGLVQFSYNGIDAVNAVDRRLVFAAVRRVLAPGGVFLFSTLNMDGPAFRERPWHPTLPRVRNPLRFGFRLARALGSVPVNLLNWARLSRRTEVGDGYAVAPLSAHHWGVLAHYTTLARQLDELEREGFSREVAVFENREGRRLLPSASTAASDYFHIITRRL